MADQQLTTKFEVRLDKNGTVAEMIVPGFGYSDFDRAGKVSIPVLVSKLETARYLQRLENFLGLPKPLPREYLAIMGVHYTLQTQVLQALKRPGHLLMKTCWSLATVGKSSIVWKQTLGLHGDREIPILTSTGKMVLMNQDTHKPQPLPEMYRERNLPIVGNDLQLQFPPIPEIPGDSFHKTFTMNHSDVDENFHVNNSVYLRLSLDTAAAAIASDALPGFHGDICLYPLEEMGVQYRQESFAGDTLTAHVWGAGGPGCLVFVITKKDVEGPIFFADMKFSLQQYPSLARL